MAAEAKAGRELADETVREATGRTMDEWEALLDARGAAELPHGKIVELLADGLLESGWWQQSVTVAYEKRKGRRILGQTADGTFQIGVRRTLPLTLNAAWALMTSPEGVRAWLGDAPKLSLQKGEKYAIAGGAAGEVRVVQPGSHLRLTRQAPGWAKPSTIQVRVEPAAGGRSVLSFHEERLPAAEDREARRRHFEAALDALQRQAGA